MALSNSESNDLHKLAVLIEKGISVTLSAGDIQIGAVEIKNGTTDTRATVTAASTAAQATDTSLVVALNPNTPLGAGSNIIGNVRIDQTTAGTTNGVVVNSGTITAVTSITNALPAGTNTLGNVGVLATSTAGTSTRVRSLTANSTAVVIKASAGNLYGWNIVNTAATTIYVKIYNIAAASVNPASDVPIKTLQVAPNGSVYQEPNCIQTYANTALSARCVTGTADNDTTAPATSPILEFEII